MYRGFWAFGSREIAPFWEIVRVNGVIVHEKGGCVVKGVSLPSGRAGGAREGVSQRWRVAAREQIRVMSSKVYRPS